MKDLSDIVGTPAVEDAEVTETVEASNDDKFAIQTEINVEDLSLVAEALKLSVERGTWKMEEVGAIYAVHSKIAKFLTDHLEAVKARNANRK